MSTKTFRGRLADGGIETIRLSTNDGLTGYRILKFQVMPNDPTDNNQESISKIFTIEPSAATDTVDFTDGTLVGVAYWKNADIGNYSIDSVVIFDNVTFNQDIYISTKGDNAAVSMNYHIELEQVALNLNEATVATLKDMRGRE